MLSFVVSVCVQCWILLCVLFAYLVCVVGVCCVLCVAFVCCLLFIFLVFVMCCGLLLCVGRCVWPFVVVVVCC